MSSSQDTRSPHNTSQLLSPRPAHTLAPQTSQSSIRTAEAGRPDDTNMLAPTVSCTSQQTIRWNDLGSRGASVSNLPEREKQEYAPCRCANLPSSQGIRWRAVLAVAAGFCQQALSWGFIMIYGSQFTYFEDVLLPGLSRVELSLPGALAPMLLLMFSMVHGRLCDAHYHRWINIVGSVFLISGFFCLTFSSGPGNAGDGNYGIIVLAYILQGLGQSSFFVTSSHIASSWYPDKPALPIGITSCGVAVAGIVWPVMFQEGASSWGFRNAVGGMTGLVILLCIFVCIFGMPDPEQERRALGRPLRLRTWIDPAALTNLEWIFATASTCFIYLALLVVPQFMEDWATVRELAPDADQAVLLLTIAMGCSLVGRLGGSWIAGHCGFRLTHAAFNFAQMVWIFCFWTLATTWGHAVAFAVVTGVFIGAIITLPPGGMKEVVSGRSGTPALEPASPASGKSTATLTEKVPSGNNGGGVITANSPSSTVSSSTVDLRANGHAHHPSCVNSMAALAAITPGDDRKTRLGQWLGTSFLFAAAFVLTGNLATSRLVGRFGIQAAGWWAGTCYGLAGVALLLSVLASRMKGRVSGVVGSV